MRRTGLTARLITLALIAALMGSTAPLGAQTAGPTAPASTAPAAVPPELARFNLLLADLAERLKPALVHIRVRRDKATKEEEAEPGDPRRSTGSGFIIDPGGTIVTNAHVVEGSDWIQVRTFDGRRSVALAEASGCKARRKETQRNLPRCGKKQSWHIAMQSQQSRAYAKEVLARTNRVRLFLLQQKMYSMKPSARWPKGP